MDEPEQPYYENGIKVIPIKFGRNMPTHYKAVTTLAELPEFVKEVYKHHGIYGISLKNLSLEQQFILLGVKRDLKGK